MASLVLFFCILFSVGMGIGFNLLSTKKFSDRWKRVLVILGGFALTELVMLIVWNIAINKVHTGPVGVGEALGIGIGVAVLLIILLSFGAVFYIVSTVLTSVVKRIKLRKPLKSS